MKFPGYLFAAFVLALLGVVALIGGLWVLLLVAKTAVEYAMGALMIAVGLKILWTISRD